MRIKKCYIENFGTLHEFEYEFQDGLNTINEMNGWGKTTFAVFIKSMYYGMEYVPRKKTVDNDRKKYFPWQGGNFGGYLIFEIKDKLYKIERFFGKKDKEDTFVLYDLATGLKSQDYSEAIGEEIFHIDRDSYERSTYIPQKAIAVSMTDSINAKLSNLVENGNDINNYENALASLEEHLKEYKKTGGRGKLADLQEKIFTKKQELEDCKNKIQSMALIEEQITKQQDLRRGLVAKRDVIKEEIRKESGKKEKVAKMEHYAFIQKQIAEVQEKIEPLDQIFYKGMPEYRELEESGMQIEELGRLYMQKNNGQLTETEQHKLEALKSYFASGAPTPSDIEEGMIQLNQLQKIENDKIRQSGQLEVLAKRRQQVESEKQAVDKKSPLLLYAGILVALPGIVYGLLTPLYIIGVISLVVGLGIITAGRIFQSKGSQEVATKLAMVIKDEQQQKQQLDELESKKQQLEVKSQKFFEQYPSSYSETNLLQAISEVQTKSVEYRDFMGREAYYQTNQLAVETKIAEMQEQIEAYISRYMVLEQDTNMQYTIESQQKLKEVHQILRDYYKTYVTLQESLEKQEEEKKVFEQENNITKEGYAREETEKQYSLEELQLQEKEKEEELELLDEQIHSYRKDLDTLSLVADTQSEIENEIELWKIALEEGIHKCEILERTIEYLKKAKESFSTHYMGAMSRGFAKYANDINGNSPQNIQFDIQLQAQLDVHGSLKGSEYFSTGNQDFIGICIHLALVEALFEEEKPFLILDDPFVNLDDEKIEHAKALLKKIAKQYQIIYFICHSSRKA